MKNAPESRLALSGLGFPALDLLVPGLRPAVYPRGDLDLLPSSPLLFVRIELSDDSSHLGIGSSGSSCDFSHGASRSAKLADLGYWDILTT